MVEDKILEYLDGSLGDRESAELLETLSVSPEKRALLEEHLRLKDLLTLGRKPFSVPIETERALAQRIPILGDYEKEAAPLLGRFAAARSWIGVRAVGLATGAAVAVILLAVGWYSLGRSASTPELTNGTIAAASRSMLGTTRTKLPANNLPPQNAHNFAETLPSHSANSRLENYEFLSRDRARSSSTIDASSASSRASRSTEKDYPMTSVSPIPASQVSARAIPIGHFSNTLSELQLPEPGALSPISMGGSFLLDQLYLPVASGPSHSILAPTGDLTLDYDLSPSLSFGLAAGTAQGTALRNSSSYALTPTGNYSRLTQNALLTNQMFYDLLLTAHVTLFPESEYQIRIGAAGGDAFGAGPVAEGTAGISCVLAPNLIFDLTAVVSRLWTNGSAAALTPPSSGGVVGIVGQQVASSTLYSTAFGISVGVRMRLPE